MTTTPDDLRPVKVVWEDAACIDTGVWVSADDGPAKYEPVLVTSVGFLVHQSEQGIIITSAKNTGSQMAPRDQIPAGMIRSIEFLEAVPSKRKAAK